MKAFSTIVTALNDHGKLEVFEGPPVFAPDRKSAEVEVKRLFPYAQIESEDNAMNSLADKLFENIDD